MKVILTEKIKTLGNVGEIVNVSPGYGRNFLIPGKFAVLADDAHKKSLANHQRRLSKKIEEQKNGALALKKKIDGLTIKLTKKVGSNGRLFGTVTNTDLSKELLGKEIEIERRLITITTPIKTLGESEVTIKLFKDVEAVFKVNVEMDPEQVKEMKLKQEAAEKKAKAKKNKKEEEKEAGEEKTSDEDVTPEEA